MFIVVTYQRKMKKSSMRLYWFHFGEIPLREISSICNWPTRNDSVVFIIQWEPCKKQNHLMFLLKAIGYVENKAKLSAYKVCFQSLNCNQNWIRYYFFVVVFLVSYNDWKIVKFNEKYCLEYCSLGNEIVIIWKWSCTSEIIYEKLFMKNFFFKFSQLSYPL